VGRPVAQVHRGLVRAPRSGASRGFIRRAQAEDLLWTATWHPRRTEWFGELHFLTIEPASDSYLRCPATRTCQRRRPRWSRSQRVTLARQARRRSRTPVPGLARVPDLREGSSVTRGVLVGWCRLVGLAMVVSVAARSPRRYGSWDRLGPSTAAFDCLRGWACRLSVSPETPSAIDGRRRSRRASVVSMAIGFSPSAATVSPRWWPSFLPTGGHEAPHQPLGVVQVKGLAPFPVVAWASRWLSWPSVIMSTLDAALLPR
jgi:hypothetical protein